MSEKKAFLGTALRLWKSESGAIISAELVLVLTIAVLAMIVGLSSLSNSINHELEDLAEAFGALDQTFQFTGLGVVHAGGTTSIVPGSSFNDTPDVACCDCVGLEAVQHPITVPPKCE